MAQIRREYLINTSVGIRALAVCSDETAGFDPNKEERKNAAKDPTIDNSNVSELEVKGKVTTDAREIAQWIEEGDGSNKINVIFGTYQSSSKVSEALLETQTQQGCLSPTKLTEQQGCAVKRRLRIATLRFRGKNPRFYLVPSQQCIPCVIPNQPDSHSAHLRYEQEQSSQRQ